MGRSARRALRFLVAAGAAAGGSLLVPGTSAPADGSGLTSCSFAGNVLTVTVREGGIGEIKRAGPAIAVRERDAGTRRCSGGDPTVLTTDTIKVVLRGVAFADLHLGGGPFAPGLTPEPDGAAEIEVEIATDLGGLEVVGTAGADTWHWGPSGVNPALNLNPGEAQDRDVDVTVAGDDEAAVALYARGAGGDDTIIGAPGATVRGVLTADGGPGDDVLRSPRIRGVVGQAGLLGAAGDDVLTGSGSHDDLSGGTGNDRIEGRGGADKISGGRGRDRLYGGAGADVIRSADLSTDRVSCGLGHDRVHRDRRDRLTSCEDRRR
jgi:hypothetical protein